MNELRKYMVLGKAQEATLDASGVLSSRVRICIPWVDGIIQRVLMKAHSSQYSIYPSVTKIYQDLKWLYWSPSMNKNIADLWLSAKTIIMWSISIKGWKVYFREFPFMNGSGKRKGMEFMVRLSKTLEKFNSILVMVGRITKSAYFIPIRVDYNAH